jgi:alpha-tubulin suppressor-like RCC1 family protein
LNKPTFIEKYDLTNTCSGLKHTIILNQNKLYTFGYNDVNNLIIFKKGQLGFDKSIKFQNTPKELMIKEDSNIIELSCGRFHTLVLFENGKIYGFGSNLYGQLGQKILSDFILPKIIYENVDQITTGEYNSLILTKKDKLFSFGSNIYGQLGLDDNIPIVNEPREINNNFLNSKVNTFNKKGKKNFMWVFSLFCFIKKFKNLFFWIKHCNIKLI